ncbi:MAG: hypothetical protein N2560_08145 [Ignavibacteria bacterium]|nr:hypothetical protein [Ignavibacteria bacterium]
MKVVSVKILDNCFVEKNVVECSFDEKITREIIFKIGKQGVLQYYPEFPKPFFKIHIQEICDIKGVEGSKTLRIFLKNPKKYTLENIISFLLNF